MPYTIDDEEMTFHALFIGSTGAGKTNATLFWLRRLFSNRKDFALVLIDPLGRAPGSLSIQVVLPKGGDLLIERILLREPYPVDETHRDKILARLLSFLVVDAKPKLLLKLAQYREEPLLRHVAKDVEDSPFGRVRLGRRWQPVDLLLT